MKTSNDESGYARLSTEELEQLLRSSDGENEKGLIQEELTKRYSQYYAELYDLPSHSTAKTVDEPKPVKEAPSISKSKPSSSEPNTKIHERPHKKVRASEPKPQPIKKRKRGCIWFILLLLGVIVFALFLIGVAIVSSYSGSRNSSSNISQQASSSRPTSTPKPTSARTSSRNEKPTSAQFIDLVAKHEPPLMEAVWLAGDVESEAFFFQDRELLSDVYTGNELRNRISHIDDLNSQGVYQHQKRLDIWFEHFYVSNDEKYAEVYVVEVWETFFLTIGTDDCAGWIPEHELPQTIYFESGINGWMIYEIDVHADPTDILPCP